MLDIRIHIDGQSAVIEHAQKCDPILDWNAEARRDEQKSDWGRHIARIPNVLYVKWFDEEVARGNTTLVMYSEEFDQIVQRKLYDPEYAYLRVDKPPLQLGFLGDVS